MICKHMFGAAALGFFWMVGSASAAQVEGAAADDTVVVPSPAWLDAVAGQKLQAVDGSSLMLSPTDGSLALAVTSPAGDTQTNTYVMMSDKLGTIGDGPDGTHLIGVFRTTDKGFEAQFADGHSESLALNAAGGLSVKLTTPQKSTACMTWYPQGHAFSSSERRAALAEYAQRLGLNSTAKASHTAPACDVSVLQPAKLAATLTIPVRSPDKGQSVAKEKSAANDKGLVPVLVRTSIVHPIDIAATTVATAPVVAMTPKAPPVVTMTPVMVPVNMRSVAQTAPVAPIVPVALLASAAPVEPGHGASGCLSVDNDGANLGFRNQCGFSVTFSYCLEKAADPAVACDAAGSRVGNVAANGFVSLLADTNIKAEDAEHEFRWVGCTGNAAEVVAHLDKAEPPAGRCVRSTAS